MKTYSVLMAWHNHDPEQGEYGATVRAENSEDAVRQTRRLMWGADLFHDGDPVETPPDAELEWKYGRVIECEEGAIWAANDLEEALRALLTIVLDARADENADAMSTAGGYLFGDVMSGAVEQAVAVLAKIEEPEA